jgi:single-strand DNA-binding protein
MASLNKVLLIGNLTKDPELRYTPSGVAVVNLRLAINRKYKDKSGEMKEDVCYITVAAWDKQAEVCNQYLKKGRPVFVEGRLQSRSWEGADGTKKSTIDVRAERIQFLNSSSREGAAPQAAPSDEYSAPEHPGQGTSEVKHESVSWDEEENVG